MHRIIYTIVCLITYSSLRTTDAFDANHYKLTIIHANDLLSAFAGVNSFHNSQCDLNTELKQCLGGAQRIVSKIKEFRAKGHILFVNSGNNLAGFWYNNFGSKVVIDFMRELQFDVITFGLSDYALHDHSIDPTESYQNMTQFINDVSIVSRIVSCNVDIDTKYVSNFYSNVRKSTKLLIGSRRIGIIGFVREPNDINFDGSQQTSAFDLIKIRDPIRCLQEEAEYLRKEGIDIIVAIGSGDEDYFKKIAYNVTNIDAVIGSFAYSKNISQLKERRADNYPDFVVTGSYSNVVIATADVFGKSIGKLSLDFDERGHMKSVEGQLIKLDDSIESDKRTSELIDTYQRSLIIGTTSIFLNGSDCGTEECNLGNVIADSLVFFRINYINETFVKRLIQMSSEKNDILKSRIDEVRDVIGLIDGQTISDSIGKLDKTNYFISKIDLDRVLLKTQSKHENTVNLYILSGKAIKDMIETKLAIDGDNYHILQVSGINVTFDVSKPKNERITDISVKCTLCPRFNQYNQLDDTKFYDVLLPKSIQIESDDNSLEIMTDLKLYDIAEQYIRETSPINTDIEQRITIERSYEAKNRTNGRLSIHSMVIYFIIISILFKTHELF